MHYLNASYSVELWHVLSASAGVQIQYLLARKSISISSYETVYLKFYFHCLK